MEERAEGERCRKVGYTERCSTWLASYRIRRNRESITSIKGKLQLLHRKMEEVIETKNILSLVITLVMISMLSVSYSFATSENLVTGIPLLKEIKPLKFLKIKSTLQ